MYRGSISLGLWELEDDSGPARTFALRQLPVANPKTQYMAALLEERDRGPAI